MIDGNDRTEDFSEERHTSVWSVWRQDDNGNVFPVKDGLTEMEALRLVRAFERKGHKQAYWAKQDEPVD